MSDFSYKAEHTLILAPESFYTVEITEGNGTKYVKAKIQYGTFLWPDYPGVLLTFDNNDFVIVSAYRIVSVSTFKETHLKVVK